MKNVSFSYALHAVKVGRRIRRAGWNGKGMWVAYSPGNTVEPGRLWSTAAAAWSLKRKEPVEVLPYLIMKTADDKIVPWLISQTDVLAADWEVVGDED
jgi:hypothetical protein